MREFQELTLPEPQWIKVSVNPLATRVTSFTEGCQSTTVEVII